MTAQGKWNITIKTPIGDRSGVLDLIVDGDKLSGSMSDAEHFAPISAGRLDGNKLSWSAKMTKPLNITLRFTAVIDADQIEGKAKHLLGSASFRGSRA